MPWLETDPVTERKRFIIEWLSGEFTVLSADATRSAARPATSGLPATSVAPRASRTARGGRTLPRHRSGPDRGGGSDPLQPSPGTKSSPTHRALSRPGRSLRTHAAPSLHPSRTGQEATTHRKRPHPGRPTDAPNSVWSADFKGQFKTLDGVYCYPLTVQDGFSRYLLGCQGLAGTTFVDTKRVFTRLFHEFGIPTRIRTDNGPPFASMALGRLSRLSVW